MKFHLKRKAAWAADMLVGDIDHFIAFSPTNHPKFRNLTVLIYLTAFYLSLNRLVAIKSFGHCAAQRPCSVGGVGISNCACAAHEAHVSRVRSPDLSPLFSLRLCPIPGNLLFN